MKEKKLAEKMITNMELDNGCKFRYTPDMKLDLMIAIKKTIKAGLDFEQVIDDMTILEHMTMGAQEDLPESIRTTDGYEDVNKALNDIFNSEAYKPPITIE